MEQIEIEQDDEPTARQPRFKRGESLLDAWDSDYSDPFTFSQDWF